MESKPMKLDKLVNFRCPLKLLEEFDETIKGRYRNRTDALLDAMDDLIEKRGRAYGCRLWLETTLPPFASGESEAER